MVLEVLRALLRRWYVVALGVLLTAGLVFGAGRSSPPSYHARGLVLMLPSKVAVGKGGNPLLVLDGLEQPASILVAHFASAPAKAEVATLSPTAQFTVLLDESIRGPVIAVDVTDSSPEATMAVLRHLMAELPKRLTTLQQQVDASSNSYISSMPLSADSSPAQDRSATLRLMIAALLLGVVGTVIGTFGFDSFMQRRQTRRTQGEDDSANATPTPTSTSLRAGGTDQTLIPPQEAVGEPADIPLDVPVEPIDAPALDFRRRRRRDRDAGRVPQPVPDHVTAPVSEPAPEAVTEAEIGEHVGSSRT